MSHFLNPDSDKKKSALTSTFSRFFCAAAPRAFPQRQSLGEATQSAAPPARDDCAASPKLFFLFGRAVPMLAHGVSWCCAAPPALAPATRKTREQSVSTGMRRCSASSLCKRKIPKRRHSRGNGARGSDARGFLFAYPYFRYAPRGNAADSFSANEKSVPAGTQPRRERFSLSEKKKIISFSFR